MLREPGFMRLEGNSFRNPYEEAGRRKRNMEVKNRRKERERG